MLWSDPTQHDDQIKFGCHPDAIGTHPRVIIVVAGALGKSSRWVLRKKFMKP